MITGRTIRLTGGKRDEQALLMFVHVTQTIAFSKLQRSWASLSPSPSPPRLDRAPFALYTSSTRKFTIRNHCLRFGLYSCGETIPQRFNVTTFAIIRIIIISFPHFLKRAKTRIHYTVGDNYHTKTMRLLVATSSTLQYIHV